MYSVIAYLTLFRLNELGFERFRFVLAGQEAHKMVTLLSWITSVDNLNTWCVEDWCRCPGMYAPKRFCLACYIGGTSLGNNRLRKL